jgi:hypothetical protein
VLLHRLSASLDLGDVTYVADRGAGVETDGLPIERQVTHLIDLARALSLLAKDQDALQVLLSAEQKSPQLLRHSATAREVVRTRYHRRWCRAGTSRGGWGAAAPCRAAARVG